MNFYELAFPEKHFFENIGQKNWDLEKLPFNIYPFSAELCLQTKNLDYICNESEELQRNLNHFNFF